MPPAETDQTTAGDCCIENFRPAAGINNIYRCASTDGLGSKDDNDILFGPDLIVYKDARLILDLRSASERDEGLAQSWMSRAPRGPMVVVEADQKYAGHLDKMHQRFVVRIDVLSPSRFMSYITENWLTPKQRAQAAWFKVVDSAALHELRIESLNERGLAGLNEAIFETGKGDLLRALQIITLHLEENPEDGVVIHCVQGKDR
jgi:hypothetical protein